MLLFVDRTELDFTVVVDFTKSNLPMQDQSSLHRRDRMFVGQFEMKSYAIVSPGTNMSWPLAQSPRFANITAEARSVVAYWHNIYSFLFKRH